MTEPDLADLATRGWRYALSLTGDAAEADDLAQEAWTSVLKARGTPSRGYLLRAIRSRWIDAWRRRGDVVTLSLEALPTPAQAPDRLEAAQQISIAFAALRPEEREVLHLCVAEGYTAAEVAEIVEKPRNTVLSLIHRGRARLRAALTEANREALP